VGGRNCGVRREGDIKGLFGNTPHKGKQSPPNQSSVARESIPPNGEPPDRVQRRSGGVGGTPPPVGAEPLGGDGGLRVAGRRRAPPVPLVPALGVACWLEEMGLLVLCCLLCPLEKAVGRRGNQKCRRWLPVAILAASRFEDERCYLLGLIVIPIICLQYQNVINEMPS
jgi:hypothetical protein